MGIIKGYGFFRGGLFFEKKTPVIHEITVYPGSLPIFSKLSSSP